MRLLIIFPKITPQLSTPLSIAMPTTQILFQGMRQRQIENNPKK